MNEIYTGEVIKNEPLLSDGSVFSLSIKLPYVANLVSPGMIAHIDCGLMLRRPFAVADAHDGIIRFCCDIRGEGTRRLSLLKAGDKVSVLGPFGHGWPEMEDVAVGKKILAVGGGTGIYSLLPLARKYGASLTAAIGFRSESRVVSDTDFAAFGSTVYLATEDGTKGRQGFVTDMVRPLLESGEYCALFTCGPHIMMKKAYDIAKELNIPTYVSLEERMGCGVGACMGCVAQIKEADGTVKNKRVCVDGPVFAADSVVW